MSWPIRNSLTVITLPICSVFCYNINLFTMHFISFRDVKGYVLSYLIPKGEAKSLSHCSTRRGGTDRNRLLGRM